MTLRQTLGLVGLVFALGSDLAHAVLTIGPNNGGALGGPYSFSSTYGSALVQTFYYFVQSGTTTAPSGNNTFMLVTPLILANNQDTAGESSLTNMFEITVSSNQIFTYNSSQPTVIMLSMAYSGGSHYIPIAAVDGVACTSGNPRCFGKNYLSPDPNTNLPGTSSPRYFAVTYPAPNATTRVGFYPTDACLSDTTNTVNGCDTQNTSIVAAPTAGKPTVMQLTASLVTWPTPNQTEKPTATLTNLDTFPSSGKINLSFQIDTPSFNCADSNFLKYLYFPGDSQIKIDMAGSGASGTGFTLIPVSSSNAPANALVVVGAKDNADPSIDKSTFRSNPVYGTVSWGGQGMVGTLVNSTQNAQVPYKLSFLGRDQAGIYIQPTGGVAACSLPNVYSSSILGVAGGSNCFIATAAFGSGEAGPVMLLRKFRDEVLLSLSLGNRFVEWYYDWSPGAADWLLDHPVFRLPVLLALLPLEALAWMVLNPACLFVLFGFTIFGVLILNSVSNKQVAGADET